ncbi:hypothetical protein L6164_035280 [Bauhinia variegata]|uniref:Uncharacterized protein n=1 Tax=Bauhinia variegata TaxID=167791 RepID=A0ACB9KY86_BAUVA|nr:hypothetical protein L6164_035280 [Bauhinia variegata]
MVPYEETYFELVLLNKGYGRHAQTGPETEQKSDLSSCCIGNERQVRSPAQNTGDDAVNEARNTEDEKQIVTPNHDPKSDPGVTRRENPVKQMGEDQEDVESYSLHGIEPDIVAEARVSDNSQIEGEEGDEAGVRDGPIEAKKRKDWVKEKP